MSVHNIVKASIVCPRCGQSTDADIEGFFGFGNLITYRIGDTVQWVPRKAVQHGGRPPNGDLDAEGYVVCDKCGKDAFVIVKIRADKIVSVEPNPNKPGYMP